MNSMCVDCMCQRDTPLSSNIVDVDVMIQLYIYVGNSYFQSCCCVFFCFVVNINLKSYCLSLIHLRLLNCILTIIVQLARFAFQISKIIRNNRTKHNSRICISALVNNHGCQLTSDLCLIILIHEQPNMSWIIKL